MKILKHTKNYQSGLSERLPACILIYLGIRHISHVADAVMWLKDLLNPLLIGLILALFSECSVGGY